MHFFEDCLYLRRFFGRPKTQISCVQVTSAADVALDVALTLRAGPAGRMLGGGRKQRPQEINLENIQPSNPVTYPIKFKGYVKFYERIWHNKTVFQHEINKEDWRDPGVKKPRCSIKIKLISIHFGQTALSYCHIPRKRNPPAFLFGNEVA